MLDIEFVLKGKGVISVEIKFSQPQPGRKLSFNEDEKTRINLVPPKSESEQSSLGEDYIGRIKTILSEAENKQSSLNKDAIDTLVKIKSILSEYRSKQASFEETRIKFSQPEPGRNLSFNEDEETRINLNEDGARGRRR